MIIIVLKFNELSLSKAYIANCQTRRFFAEIVLFVLASLVLTPETQAANSFSPTGFLLGSGNNDYEAGGISADGSVVVGNFATAGSSVSQAFRRQLSGDNNGLGFLNGDNNSLANAVNANGSVVVGVSLNLGIGFQAFRWTEATGVMSPLGFLPGTQLSEARAVNADGSIVVGSSRPINGNYQAFRWTESSGQMSALGFLAGGNSSEAYGVSADGTVVVGQSSSTLGLQAFRWSELTGQMSSLGFLAGGNESAANAISADSKVVVGYSTYAGSGSLYQAFRWTEAIGTPVGLGFLPGDTASVAKALNSDGSVVVGYSTNSNGDDRAFRWALTPGSNSGVMQSVEAWLHNAGVSTSGFSRLNEATGVSASGNTIVGVGTNGDNQPEVFVARVGPESGIVGLSDLGNSIAQTLAVSSQMDSLNSLVMNGAHHRTLMDMAISDGKNCAWADGDLGRAYRQANGYLGSAEVGICHDFADQDIRVGVGAGSSYADLDLTNQGHSRLNGQYGIAEIDWKLPGKPLVASLLGMVGKWDATLKRGYAIAGTTPSNGNTDVTSYSIRGRLDWKDAFYLGKVTFSPRLAYTITHTEVSGYQETGGSAAATFQSQNHTAHEARLGLTGKYLLNIKTSILGHAELIHRFDGRGASIDGNAKVLGLFNVPFSMSGNRISENWMRLGVELDYRANQRSILSASSFIATQGQDADLTVAMSYKYLF